MNAYLHGTSPTPLLGETIGENLRRTVERFGDREALVVRSQGYRATYRELWDQTTVLARALLASGVQKGDRVGIWSPNRFEWVITQFARRADRRDPRQHQPGLQDVRAAVRADAVGRLAADPRRRVPRQRLHRHGARGLWLAALSCAKRLSSTPAGGDLLDRAQRRL